MNIRGRLWNWLFGVGMDHTHRVNTAVDEIKGVTEKVYPEDTEFVPYCEDGMLVKRFADGKGGFKDVKTGRTTFLCRGSVTLLSQYLMYGKTLEKMGTLYDDQKTAMTGKPKPFSGLATFMGISVYVKEDTSQPPESPQRMRY